MQALGLDFEILTASDSDPAAREFITKNFGSEVKHLHHTTCSQIQEPELGSDLFVAGIPCKPYSRARTKRFAFGSVKSHASHGTLFEDFCPWLDEHNPKTGLFENVRGLADKLDNSTDVTPLEMLPGLNLCVCGCVCVCLCLWGACIYACMNL